MELSSILLLGGSWLRISGGTLSVTRVMTYISGLISPLISTHEPPSRPSQGSGSKLSILRLGPISGTSRTKRQRRRPTDIETYPESLT